MRGSGSTVAVSTALRFAALAAVLLISIVVGRELGPEGRGTYQVILTVALLAATFGGLSMELGFSRILAQGLASLARIASTAMISGPLQGCVAALVTVVTVRELLPDDLGTADLQIATALGVAIPLMLTNAWCQRIVLLRGLVVTSAAAPLSNALVTLAGIVVLAASGRLGVAGALACAVLGCATETIIYAVLLRPRAASTSTATWARGARAGLAFHPSQVALALLMRLDMILLAALGGSTQVGLYAIAVSITTPLAVVASSVNNAFLSNQFSTDALEARRSAATLTRYSALVTVALALVAAVSTPVMIPMLWGREFSASVLLTLILLPGVVANAAQRPLGSYLVREGKSRVTLVRNVVALTLTVGLCLWWIPLHGAVGAAAASAIAYGLYAAVSATAFVRISGSRWSDLLPGPRDGAVLAARLRRSR